MLKKMYKEKPHYTLKDMYKEKAHITCWKTCTKEKKKEKKKEEEEKKKTEEAHQTSVPTILSTAVKAVRGAVVALGVCIHNRAISTESVRLSMTKTVECCWGLHTQHSA